MMAMSSRSPPTKTCVAPALRSRPTRPIWLSSCGRNVSTKTGFSAGLLGCRAQASRRARGRRSCRRRRWRTARRATARSAAWPTASRSASARGAEPEDRPAGLVAPVGQAVGAHADGDDRDAGLLEDRQRRLDRFGAEEADDDARPWPRRTRCAAVGAAFGGAGIVGDLERRRRLAGAAAARAPARSARRACADGPVSGAATPISSARRAGAGGSQRQQRRRSRCAGKSHRRDMSPCRQLGGAATSCAPTGKGWPTA